MEEIIIKKEELNETEIATGRQRSLEEVQPESDSQPVRMSLPGNIAAIAAKNAFPTHITQNSSQKPKPVRRTGSKHHSMPSTKRSAYSLGARCGEIFVANNAKQWTFVCTFCNKSTRDIGDFICHIKMKHLEESDEAPYGNDFYGTNEVDDGVDDEDADNDDDDDDGGECTQVQDYLDCGNYLDVNVHTESEDYNCLNGDNYDDRYKMRQYHSPALQRNRIANNWKKPEIFKKEPPLPASVKRRRDDDFVVQIYDDSDNDIEDMLETHTSHKTSTPKMSQPQQQQKKHFQQPHHRQQQQKRFYRSSETIKARNGANDASLNHSTLDVDNEDASPELMTQNDYDDYADEDYDNQLLLAPTDTTESHAAATHGTEGKIKRRQIRGTAYCALCNKTFQYYSLYRNHMIKHSNETPFKCNLCQKGFKSKQAIRYHMNTHQKEAKFKCEICESGFYTENQFIAHVLTHENATTYPCMVCGKVLHSDKERDAHLTTHTDERPFRCEFCNKLFRLRHHLSNHLKMHRQYRCEYCREEFTSAVHLRKPYACPVCENSPEAAAANTLQYANPLQLFEAVMPPTQPTECVDLAEMVSDTEEHNGTGSRGGAGGEKDAVGEQHVREEEDEEDDDDDDEDENCADGGTTTSSSLETRVANKKKAFQCKHCKRAYSHLSGLHFHMRTKHN